MVTWTNNHWLVVVATAAALLSAGCENQAEVHARLPQAEAYTPAPPPWPAQAASTAPMIAPCTAPEPQQAPLAQAATPTTAPPDPTQTTSAPPLPPSGPAPIIHEADLHGRLKNRAGKLVMIEPMVSTSSTLPAKGNKGTLFLRHKDSNDETVWIPIAVVEVASNMVPGTPVGIDILEESKELRELLEKGSTVRLRWEW